MNDIDDQKASAAKSVKKKKKKNKRTEKADGNDERINQAVSGLDVSDLHKLTALRISMTESVYMVVLASRDFYVFNPFTLRIERMLFQRILPAIFPQPRWLADSHLHRPWYHFLSKDNTITTSSRA